MQACTLCMHATQNTISVCMKDGDIVIVQHQYSKFNCCQACSSYSTESGQHSSACRWIFCTYVWGHRSDRYLSGATKKQTGHSFLDVSMAKDVGSDLCKDALMQVWLRSIRLELSLLLHPTCRGFHIRCRSWRLANCSKPGCMQLATAG